MADPHESARIAARDLAPVVSELASLKGEVYRDLGSRLEAAHAAAEAALVEAKRRVRLDEGRLASAADRKSGAVPKTGNADTHHLMGADRRAGPP